jgi:hypothetical protein
MENMCEKYGIYGRKVIIVIKGFHGGEKVGIGFLLVVDIVVLPIKFLSVSSLNCNICHSFNFEF